MHLTLTIHPRCGDPVEVLRRFGPDAVWIEFADGQVTIVPRTWTSLVPRAAPMSVNDRPVRLAPDAAIKLARWITARCTGVEYSVVIHATSGYVSFSLTNVSTGATTGFVGSPNPSEFPSVNNTGLAFDTLCSGGNSSCENWNATSWSVDISSISSGWF